MVGEARARRLFLMEAMWSRFYPAFFTLRELLAAGAIGEVRMLTADLGFRSNFNPQGRLFDLALGGGALLDVGVYPVSLASHILGKPSGVLSKAHLGETGVDEQAGIMLSYPQGQIALLHTAIRTTTLHEATLMGTEGLIRLELDWRKPDRITLIRPGREPETISCPIEGNAHHNAMRRRRWVSICARGGIKSPIMPLDETIEVMETLDAIRGQWGLRYPNEC
ncbi:MAG: Gfo/Idh/MocA family oxidoreductase [Thermomicrobiales bacterium]